MRPHHMVAEGVQPEIQDHVIADERAGVMIQDWLRKWSWSEHYYPDSTPEQKGHERKHFGMFNVSE